MIISQKCNTKVIVIWLISGLSIILCGCGTHRINSEVSSYAEPTKAVTVTENEAEATIAPTITPVISPVITPLILSDEKVIDDLYKDVDGNGMNDSIQIIRGDDNVTGMLVCLNGDQILEYEDPLCNMMGVDAFECLDLDGDNINELFITASTNTNSRPYEEVLCLKQSDDTWNRMDYPKNEGGYNEFPFKITRGKNEFDFLISSGDTDQVIEYDASRYFSDSDSVNSDTVQSYRGNHYKEGDEVGFISAWGIWEAKIGTYEGQDCIIALQGMEGPYGHGLGKIAIYYAYDEEGKVDILNLEYLTE